jgi:hypothetical protein
MGPFLLPRHLNALRHLDAFGICYVNNPKVGCSSVKQALWLMEDRRTGAKTYDGNPHAPIGHPFGKLPGVFAALEADRPIRVFSMVRNPYLRALSAYSSKIGKKSGVWTKFCTRYGLDPERQLSFRAFLRLLTFDAPECMDEHFAPQTTNLMQPWLQLDTVYRLEEPGPLWQWLQSHTEMVISTDPVNVTNAKGKLSSYYDDGTARLVRRIYAADFEAFGYSTDFESATESPASPVPMETNTRSRSALLRAMQKEAVMGTLLPEDGEKRLEELRLSLDGAVSAQWFDYMRLLVLGARTPRDMRMLENLAARRRHNWRLLDDLVRIARKAGAHPLAQHIGQIRHETLTRHREELSHLPYLTAASAGDAAVAA